MDVNNHYQYMNLPLPYEYSALEPYIDTKTMIVHHDKHLQTYIDNLNMTLEPYPEYYDWPLESLLYYIDELPMSIQASVCNYGGGVYNHRFYFDGVGPQNGRVLSHHLIKEINNRFGSYEEFRKEFKKAALSVFGSGYAWLVMTCENRLQIVTSANQNSPISNHLIPILNIDVWEHAYYLKHYNKRTDYIDDWFQVINWKTAEERYLGAMN